MFEEDMFFWHEPTQEWQLTVLPHSLQEFSWYLFDLATSFLESGEHLDRFKEVMAITKYQLPFAFERRSGYLDNMISYSATPVFTKTWMNMLLNDVDMWMQQIVCYMFKNETTKIQDKWGNHYSKLYNDYLTTRYVVKKEKKEKQAKNDK